MYGKKIIGLGALQDKWSVLGFFSNKKLAENRLKKEKASQKRMIKEFPKLKKYAREFADPSEWKDMFVKKDRIILASKLADYYYDEIMSGNYD